MDLELVTVHTPTNATEPHNNYKYANLSVLFDRTNYSPWVTDKQIAIIDQFFDDIFQNYDYVNDRPNPSLVRYGDLMNALNTDHRWV